MHRRKGFSLVELLVVMVIIALLMGLLFPAIQAARESARKTACRNNLYQISKALLNYEASRTRFPSSWRPPSVYDLSAGGVSGWSPQAQLLPYLEQKATHAEIDYNQPYSAAPPVTTADGKSVKLSALRVPTYLCPSEVRDEPRLDGSGNPNHYPLNYGVNMGVWFVWDPVSGKGGDGAFYPNSKLTAGDFLDGQSYTLAFAEVKGWQDYYRNAQHAAPAMPTSVADLCALAGDFRTTSGHTEWVDGRAHQIGFTTVFPPNQRVFCENGGVDYDVDWNNQQEGNSPTVPTYAAVTARSYHEGMVNVAMMDGSVRPIEDDINIGVWRALSTRRGQEILPDSF
jgi:prepilin-type N-terminal cleavage/methylation domain-containing protein/prepilin-type processing-associated H-X9-DG protein